MNHAYTYLKAEITRRQTRLESLRGRFQGALTRLRTAFDEIAQDFNRYSSAQADQFFTAEEEIARIYQDMKAAGEKAEYAELVKDITLYMEKRLHEPPDPGERPF